MTAASLSVLTFNIGNPAPDRARRQLAWLISRDEHVLVLTETKASAGCRMLAEEFTAAGYAVHWPDHGPGEYGAMIVSTVAATPDNGFGDRVGYLPSRAAAVILPAPAGPLRVIGLYVPARDDSIEKTERKRKWLAACDAALAATVSEMPVILLGDLNILEHSWVGWRGDGYRYDHAFCSDYLSRQVIACEYLHQPRIDKLSDHSALTMQLAILPPPVLPPVTFPAPRPS